MPILLWLYGLALTIGSAIAARLPQVGSKLRARQLWREQLQQLATEPLPGTVRLWIHAASAGEFEHIRSVLERLRQELPQLSIVLSFFSPSGLAAHGHTQLADRVLLLPPDTPTAAQRFLHLVRPHVAVFVRYELWPNYLWRLRQAGIPILLVAATFPRSPLWRMPGLRWVLRRLLGAFHTVVALTAEDAERFRRVLPRGRVEGVLDPRYDRIWAAVHREHPLALPEPFSAPDRFHIVAGSIWPADAQLLAQALQLLPAEIRSRSTLLLVPHEPTADMLHRLLELFPQALRWSTLARAATADGESPPALIIDRLGLLLSLYRYGTVAYVGGGFGRCVHNLAEPAAYGLPLACGPATDGSPDAPTLQAAGALSIVRTPAELVHWLTTMAADPEERQRRGHAARAAIEQRLGGTERVQTLLRSLLEFSEAQ